ncbi:MAG: hypothetical protein GX061_02645 [Eubacteriaceae bacterium]|nr:hypothetical protein [Eubacteriaceae bacterium]
MKSKGDKLPKRNSGLRFGDRVLKIVKRSSGLTRKQRKELKQSSIESASASVASVVNNAHNARNSAAANTKPIKGQRVKKRGSVIFLRIIAVVVFLGVLVGAAGFTLLATWMAETPNIDLSKFEFTEATAIYDINDGFYQELETSEKREAVSISEVPELISLAFVSIEDQRFYSHFGVDIRGTLKAVLQVLTTRSTSGSGGSTITQQLIKQTHLTSETSIRRKVMEWKLAFELERVLSKRKILEAYLNKINLSYAWGIQSACETYFGLPADELNVAQACILAAIMKAPTTYSPYVYQTDEDGNTYLMRVSDENGQTAIKLSDSNRERATLVLDKMLELGHISRGEYEIALGQLNANAVGLKVPKGTTEYTYFTDAVYTEVLEDLMVEYNYTREAATELLLNGGLKIYATVDPQVQEALDRAAQDDSNFYPQNSAAKAASAAMSAVTGEEINYIPQVGGAVIHNKTGYVSGIIGGREKTGNLTMNRALQKFQVGSSTKPLTVYASGIDSKKVTLADQFADAEIRWGSWSPKNSGGGVTDGPMTVRRALTNSVNLVAVQVEKCQGHSISGAYALKFGLELVPDDYNSAALGLGGYSYGQTPLAMASAYTAFPNGGYRYTPTFYRYVTDANGVTILESHQEKVQVISEQTAWLVTSVLKNVVRGGTTWISISGQQVAGKTGTTDSNVCAWFCGYTAEYSGAFWFGYDVQNVTVSGRTYRIRYGSFGGNTSKGPAGFWRDTFSRFYATKKLPSASLPGRPGGLYATKGEWLISGTTPKDYFKDTQTVIDVCAVTGNLPNGNCAVTQKTITDWTLVETFGGTYIGDQIVPVDVCTQCKPAPVIPPEEPDDPPDPTTP